jgi:hypothetical protein
MQGKVQAGDGLQLNQGGDGLRAVQVRFREGLFTAIEGWRRRQRIIPSRPEAIRTLVEQSLADLDSAAQHGVKT